jgi:hypothetical protein
VFGVPKGISGIWKTAGSRKVRLHQDTLNLTLLLGVHHRAHRKGRESLPHPVVPRDLGKGDKSYAQVCDMSNPSNKGPGGSRVSLSPKQSTVSEESQGGPLCHLSCIRRQMLSDQPGLKSKSPNSGG